MDADEFFKRIDRLPAVVGCLVSLALLAVFLVVGTAVEIILRTFLVAYLIVLLVWWVIVIPIRFLFSKATRVHYRLFDLADGICVVVLASVLAAFLLWTDVRDAFR